jgi:hypothetical protein
MFYVIPDTLLKVSLNTNKTGHHVIPDTVLKVSLNTNKTGHHVIRYNWYIVESVLVFNDTFNNVSGITYNMVTSFIGV